MGRVKASTATLHFLGRGASDHRDGVRLTSVPERVAGAWTQRIASGPRLGQRPLWTCPPCAARPWLPGSKSTCAPWPRGMSTPEWFRSPSCAAFGTRPYARFRTPCRPLGTAIAQVPAEFSLHPTLEDGLADFGQQPARPSQLAALGADPG